MSKVHLNPTCHLLPRSWISKVFSRAPKRIISMPSRPKQHFALCLNFTEIRVHFTVVKNYLIGLILDRHLATFWKLNSVLNFIHLSWISWFSWIYSIVLVSFHSSNLSIFQKSRNETFWVNFQTQCTKYYGG